MTTIQADILISNAKIVTVNPESTIIEKGNIAVTGDEISYIGPCGDTIAFQCKKEIQADGCIAMPGLINTHTHVPMSIFRGYADDLSLMTWLNDYMFPAEAKYISPESVKTGAEISCAEMLLGGITTFCDGYFFEDQVAEAVSTCGIRGVLGQGVIDYPAPGVPDPSKNIETASGYVTKWLEKNPLLKPSIFCHSPYTCSKETLKQSKKAADNSNVLFQIHVAETRQEFEQIKNEHGVSPVKYLEEIGILDKNTLLIHAVHIEDSDIEIISKTGCGISHNPESNMKLSSGIARIPELIRSGIPVGLGTDSSASNNNLDLFSEMDTAAKLHKAATLDPTVMDAETVLRMATIEGAKAIGLSDITGSLETGKKADIIIVDTRKPHLVPMYHPVSHIVYTMKSSDVRDVIVSGRLLVENRNLLSMDVGQIIDDAQVLGERISN